MSINLTIDHGNSRTKVALWHPDESRPYHQEAVSRLDEAALMRLCGREHIVSCCMCSVAGDGDEALRHLLESRCERLLVLDPASTPTPLKMGYRTPSTLGADRLAAAVGAWHIAGGGEILVVDVGTAVTYDYVSHDTFVGGNIAPGIGMRLRALNHYTARLPLVDSSGKVEAWGGDTAMALRSGAVDGVVAEIEYYRRRLSPGAKTVLTGGASVLVAPRLSFDTIRATDLVCTGLDIIARHALKVAAERKPSLTMQTKMP